MLVGGRERVSMTTIHEKAEVFRAMADRLGDNASHPFGGAYVIIPPGDSEAMQVFVIDAQHNPAQFFMLLEAKIKFALEQIEIEERRKQGFGR